jgi:hypothetical protein
MNYTQYKVVVLIIIYYSAKYSPSLLETLAFVFLLGTFVTLPWSVAPPDSALQLDVFLRQMRFVNLQIFLETPV